MQMTASLAAQVFAGFQFWDVISSYVVVLVVVLIATMAHPARRRARQ
jgi:hypothetical protein